MSEPWIDYPSIWPTQSKFMSWVRGGIRKGLWNRHPVKLEFLSKRLIKTLVGEFKNGKDKWRKQGTCELCNESFPSSNLEVDHKQGGHSLKSMEDVQNFIENMIMVREEDLQLVCKGCHKAKSYAEKQGISFQEATLEKQAIALMKQGTEAQKKWLEERYIPPASNATERRKQIKRSILNENSV